MAVCPALKSQTYQPQEWDISFLAEPGEIRSKHFGITKEAKSVRYPIRLLRYWFGFHLLRLEAERVGRPLDVAEIGVDVGQMLMFTRHASSSSKANHCAFGTWTAVDPVIKGDRLQKAGYEDIEEANLEHDDFKLRQNYDTIVVLHVLEHLFDPENAVKKMARFLRPGGSIIGGFPVLPDFLINRREAQVRKTARPMGHVSVFSPERVARMAKAAGLSLEFISGAFFMRSKGSALENSPAWMRFNIRWGQTFPSWPGEVYWLMRKPE